MYKGCILLLTYDAQLANTLIDWLSGIQSIWFKTANNI